MTNWLFIALVARNVYQLGFRRGRRRGHREALRELLALGRVVFRRRLEARMPVARVGDLVVGTIRSETKVRA